MSYTPTARLIMGVSTFPFQASNKDGMECNLFQLNDGKYEYAGYSQQEPIAQMFCMEKKEPVLEILLLCTDATMRPSAIHTAPYKKETPVDRTMSKEEQESAKEWEQLLQELPEKTRIALDESDNARMICWQEKEAERKVYEEQNRQLKEEGKTELTDKEIERKLAHHNVNGFSPVEYFIHRICYFVGRQNNPLGKSYIGRVPKEGLEQGVRDEYTFTMDDGRLLKFVLIPVDEKKPDEGIRTILQLIQIRYEHAKHTLAFTQAQEQQFEDTFWVDTHGGFRDMAMVLSSLLSLLRLDDIEAERVFGVQFQPGKKKHKIVEQKQVMEINRFVAGMEEFAAYGSTDILTEYYEQVHGRTVEDETWQVGKWLNAMNMIADGSRFSDPVMYEKGIKELKKVSDLYENDRDENRKINLEDPYFSAFINYIRKEYKLLLQEDPSPVKLIKHCYQHKLYQQALTFLESKMPDYLANIKKDESKMILFSASSKEIGKQIKRENYKGMGSRNFYVFNKYREMLQVRFEEGEQGGYYETINKIIEKFDQLDQLSVYLDTYANQPKDEETKAFYKKCTEVNSAFPEKANRENRLIKNLLLLHKGLCGCRNLYNHASEDKNRPNTEKVKLALGTYLAYVEELEESLSRKNQEKKEMQKKIKEEYSGKEQEKMYQENNNKYKGAKIEW